ncbi:tRNA lysidine(34) synthetase TilS [Corynebacterium sp. A21]|uniref:tRNA lysidine(34) synthetase TilS n=1 Tax=Corynebacterium sp. A21 TaxID=3457318 RepID=UPI003FD4954B
MPRFIGELELPRNPGNFLALRRSVRHHLKHHPADQVVVGLSGGADSLALTATALAEGVGVHAVCIDHQLQAGSGEVAEQAAAQARYLGASAEVVAVEVDRRGSMEAAARRARYAALHEVAGQRPIWVGHTLSDQAETLLLRATRGTAAGMLPVNGQIHRPLLPQPRATTVAACAELGLEPWQDPQNEEEVFSRVAVRNQVIPLLNEVFGHDVSGALARAAQVAAEDAAALDAIVDKHSELGVECAAEPTALRRRRIAAFLHAHGGAVNAATLAGVEALLVDWHGQGPVAVGGSAAGRLVVSRIGHRLSIGRE